MKTSIGTQRNERALYVPETKFGFWFLGTKTWQKEVLRVAIQDLDRLIENRKSSYPCILDVGCGQGLSLLLLNETFKPQRLVGLDYEELALTKAKKRVSENNLSVEFLQSDCAEVSLADASVDMIFCHQTFHHLIRQEEALKEFFRVLKPGGLLLFAESTKAYIHSWLIRFLFAHPMDLQRTASEYMQMVRDAGFQFKTNNTSFPYLWWSRSDLGLLELLGIKPKPFGVREETLINLVATKPS